MKNIFNNYQNINKNKLLTLLLYILIPLIILSLYYKTLSFDISGLDDDTFIKMNFMQTSITDVFKKTVFLNDISPFYRPLLPISFMIDNTISNSSPYALHTTNIMLHIISCFLIFFFFKKYYFNVFLSFLLTLIFATHPINIFAVAWIPGRNDSLLLIFTIISLIFFIEYLKNKKIYLILLHFFALTLGLLTKEVAVIIPFMCMGYYFIFHKNIQLNIGKIIFFWFTAIFSFFIIHQIMSFHIMPIKNYFIHLTNSYKAFFDYYASLYFLNIHFSPYTNYSSLILGIIAFILSFFLTFLSKLSIPEKTIYFASPILIIIISLFSSQGLYQGSRLYTSLFYTLIILGSFIESLKNKKTIYASLIILLFITSYITSQKFYVFQNAVSFFHTIDSEKPNYNINLANLYSYNLLQNGYFQEASKKIKEIAEITDYKDKYNLYLLSIIYISEKEYKKAIKILESLNCFDKEDIMIKLFICYNAIGDRTKSLFFYGQAFNIYGDEQRIQNLIAKQEEDLKNVKI